MATFSDRTYSRVNIKEILPQSTDGIYNSLINIQKSYDKNVSELDKVVDKYYSVQLSNPDAQKYLNERVSERVETIEKYMGNPAFSSEVKRGVNEIKSSMDTKLMNEWYGTQVGNKIQTEAEKISLEHPELFSETNMAYSLKDWSSWASGKNRRVGESYQGNKKYIPVADLNVMQKDIQKMLPSDTYVKMTPMGGFSYYKEEKEVILGADVEQAVDNYLNSNPQYKSQIQINSWDQYKGISDQDLQETFVSKYLPSLIKQYKSKSDNYQLRIGQEAMIRDAIGKGNKTLSTTASDEELSKIKKAKDYYDSNREHYESMLLDSIDSPGKISREQMEYLVGKESAKSNMSNYMAYSKIKDKSIVQDVANLALKRMDFQAGESAKERTFDAQQQLQKHQFELAKQDQDKTEKIELEFAKGNIDFKTAEALLQGKGISNLNAVDEGLIDTEGENKVYSGADEVLGELMSQTESLNNELIYDYSMLMASYNLPNLYKSGTNNKKIDSDKLEDFIGKVLDGIERKSNTIDVDTDGDPSTLETVSIDDDELIPKLNAISNRLLYLGRVDDEVNNFEEYEEVEVEILSPSFSSSTTNIPSTSGKTIKTKRKAKTEDILSRLRKKGIAPSMTYVNKDVINPSIMKDALRQGIVPGYDTKNLPETSLNNLLKKTDDDGNPVIKGVDISIDVDKEIVKIGENSINYSQLSSGPLKNMVNNIKAQKSKDMSNYISGSNIYSWAESRRQKTKQGLIQNMELSNPKTSMVVDGRVRSLRYKYDINTQLLHEGYLDGDRFRITKVHDMKDISSKWQNLVNLGETYNAINNYGR